MKLSAVAAPLLFAASADAWAPSPRRSVAKTAPEPPSSLASFDPLDLSEADPLASENSRDDALDIVKPVLVASLVLGAPTAASAATAFAPNAAGAALAAYGHFVSLLGMAACTVAEYLLIKPGMSVEDEDKVALADIGLGVWGVLLAYTGYLRTTQYEKGFEFYSHEPLFWFKLFLLAIYGASTFFNTTVIIKRSIDRRNGKIEPMTEALADRMGRLSKAGLVALGVIPLTATFMARGVGYNQDLPWQPLAGLVVLTLAGASYKYIKEALDFGTT